MNLLPEGRRPGGTCSLRPGVVPAPAAPPPLAPEGTRARPSAPGGSLGPRPNSARSGPMSSPARAMEAPDASSPCAVAGV